MLKSIALSAVAAIVCAAGACSSGAAAPRNAGAVDSLAGTWNVEVDLGYGPAFFVVGGVVDVGVPVGASMIPSAPDSLRLSVSKGLVAAGYEPPDFGVGCPFLNQACWLAWPSVPVRPIVAADSIIDVTKASGVYTFTWRLGVTYNLYDQIPREVLARWATTDLSAQTWADTTAGMLVRVTR